MIWEERWHPLREEWVVVAAHRQHRPWSGETIEHVHSTAPDYLSDCYLCPGNLRVSGNRNAAYDGTFVFDTTCLVWGSQRRMIWRRRRAFIAAVRPAESRESFAIARGTVSRWLNFNWATSKTCV